MLNLNFGHNLTPVYIHVSNWLESHPRSVRHAMHVTMAIALGFTLFNAGLFTVQNGRTSAMTTINGKDYGLMPIEDAKKLLKTEHATAEIQVKIGSKTVVLNAERSGVAVDANETFKSLTDTTGWNRLPLVKAVTSLFSGITPVYETNEEVLAEVVRPYVSEVFIPAKDATLAVPTDAAKPATIHKEVKGSIFNAEVVAEQLATAIAANNFTAKVTAQELLPRWTELDMRAFMPAVEAARRTSMAIEAEGKKVVLGAEVLAPMLRVDTTGAELKMTLDTELLKAYLTNEGKLFFVAPISTHTVQRDGTEVSRTEGTPGKQLDVAATAELAIASFQKGIATVTPAIASVTPEVLIARTYSNTDQGLYKKIEDFAKSRRGTFGVAAVQLSGEGSRSAFYNADEKFVTASTFKLFVAYGVLQDIEAGKISMQTHTSEGTVEHCMYEMIHYSLNGCAAALQSLVGYNNLQARVKADGMPNTNLITTVQDKHSTARDEMTLLTKLYHRELLNESSTQYLFNLLENQIYRSGIPAGSRGSRVANKVGYLYALNHDIAIVYSPKATYALVMLTDGAGGWTNVRLLAEQVYDFYNQ